MYKYHRLSNSSNRGKWWHYCVSCEPIQLARDILRVACDCLDRGNVDFICICTALLHCHPVRGALLDTHYASATMAWSTTSITNCVGWFSFFPASIFGSTVECCWMGVRCWEKAGRTLTPGAPASISVPFAAPRYFYRSAKREPALRLSSRPTVSCNLTRPWLW